MHTSVFTGLSAFPLTPIKEGGVDESAFIELIHWLVDADVDSIGALGSTGSYAYLSRRERARAAELAVVNAEEIPTIVGIGAVSLSDVLVFAEDAQKAGASGVLLAPVSYQKLRPEEVFSLYETVTREISVPLCVYDNPGTTNFEFTDELHASIATLPNVGSIKIPPVSKDMGEARARVSRLRAMIPAHVTIGISGDACAATGMLAGCDAWYSVVGGLFPHAALAIARAAQDGDADKAIRLSDELGALWSLFSRYGSLRVIATAAEILGVVSQPCLPPPLKTLDDQVRTELAMVLKRLRLESS